MRLEVVLKADGGLMNRKFSSAVVVEEMTAAMHAATQHIRGLVIPATPVGVSGTLRTGTQAKVSTEGVAMDIQGSVFNPVAYGMPVEFGRKPGKQPPSSALELWVRRKLGVPDNKVKSVAFLVARKIGRKGTNAVEMFTRAFKESEGAVNAYFNRAADRIVAKLS